MANLQFHLSYNFDLLRKEYWQNFITRSFNTLITQICDNDETFLKGTMNINNIVKKLYQPHKGIIYRLVCTHTEILRTY